jgi:F0F1-type ATP synthase membrane subunit b/b'
VYFSSIFLIIRSIAIRTLDKKADKLDVELVKDKIKEAREKMKDYQDRIKEQNESIDRLYQEQHKHLREFLEEMRCQVENIKNDVNRFTENIPEKIKLEAREQIRIHEDSNYHKRRA